MYIETERLFLMPLSLEQLILSIENRTELFKSLGLNSSEVSLSKNLIRIYNIKINNIKNDESNILFHTYWQIVIKDNNTIIGELGFKGAPNDLGQVEIGYGIKDEYRNKGYMTESLIRIIEWVFTQEGSRVKYVSAYTEKLNIASQKVLIKSGLKLINDADRLYFWQIKNTRQERMIL